MLVPHLYLNGKCEEAISQYVKAFGAEVKVLIRHSEDEPQKGILHAEIYIHGQRVMLNDIGGNNDYTQRAPTELVVIYDSVEDLKKFLRNNERRKSNNISDGGNILQSVCS